MWGRMGEDVWECFRWQEIITPSTSSSAETASGSKFHTHTGTACSPLRRRALPHRRTLHGSFGTATGAAVLVAGRLASCNWPSKCMGVITSKRRVRATKS
ncbi:hypothetical protein CBOM_07907 [Ceraceosorus bombacis]|uniref:Uncharacterized protein n=1 Tax=Ceraceosorus bombacis TaxID=401625 RepID=A0A0P1BQB2_9BASI|nr:hypothetical protein CBOM_07907 [Ceraceosorus bombacis]